MIKRKHNKQKTEREKVEERKEEVLAKGRKFKYPLQYAKYKVVLYTIIVAVVVVGALAGFGYLALYKWQSTDEMLYRLTRAIPVSVATIDGEKVRYSDYLMIYKSTIAPVEQQQGKLGDDEDSEAMRAHYKRSALTEAENYTYSLKLAREMNITIDDTSVDEAIKEHRMVGGVERSQEGFEKILKDNFNLSLSEYRRMVYLSLVKTEVAKKIDERAEQTSQDVDQQLLDKKGNFKAVADILKDKVSYEETGGMVDKMNVDGGRAAAAMKLKKGKISDRLVSTNGDGYFYVKLIDKNDTSVNYVSLIIPFEEFNNRVDALRKNAKVTERIQLADE